MRKVSALLFGRSIRLPAAAWIRSLPNGASFYQLQVARGRGIGCPPQYMHQEPRRFCELGMIERQPQAEGEVRQFYLARRSQPLWAIINVAVAASSRMTEPGGVQQLRPIDTWPSELEAQV